MHPAPLHNCLGGRILIGPLRGALMAAECVRVTRISATAELKNLTTVLALRSPLYVAELARTNTVTAH